MTIDARGSRHAFVACADRGSGAAISEFLRSRSWVVSNCTAAEAVDDPEGALESASGAYGPVSAIIANHFGYDFIPGSEMPSGFMWRDDLDAFLRLADLGLPKLCEAGGGAFVAVTYTSHFAEPADIVELASAKGAVIGAVRALAVRGGPSVRVASISPGFVTTPRVERALAALSSDDRDRFISRVLERTPLRRLGRPADLGALCAWLISDRASFVTGVDVVMDGGAVSLNRTFSYNPPVEEEIAS